MKKLILILLITTGLFAQDRVCDYLDKELKSLSNTKTKVTLTRDVYRKGAFTDMYIKFCNVPPETKVSLLKYSFKLEAIVDKYIK